MKLVVTGMFLIGLLALTQSSTRSAAPAAAPTAAAPTVAAPTVAMVDDQDDTSIICPAKWFCDDTGRFYNSRTSCQTACGSTPCYLDYACTGGCVCP